MLSQHTDGQLLSRLRLGSGKEDALTGEWRILQLEWLGGGCDLESNQIFSSKERRKGSTIY